jgi:hypothetical protein
MYKHSSLLRKSVNNCQKSFITRLDPVEVAMAVEDVVPTTTGGLLVVLTAKPRIRS